MSFFGKIKSAVMGNPVTREYEIGRQVASAGPGLMWKVHSAVKKSTRQEMSVFMFSKQTPDFEKLHKKQREMILEMLRRDPTHLVRLKHPRILTIDHPLEESSDCLAFATEPVAIGLANILGNYDNLPSPLPLPIKEYEVHPIEIQYGLYNLSEALEFLHSGVRLMHGNLNPEVVVVTGGGVWKLMGFNFSCYSQYTSESTTSFQFQEWDTKRPHNTNPSLDYLAPEYILNKSCAEMSDVFSFGMLCYAVYNGGRPLCCSLNNLLSYKQNIETISRVTESGLGDVPHGLRSLVRTMLAIEPSVRPNATDISKHTFFDEVGVATLRYLDTLYEKGDMERSQYFKKNLSLVITKLPKRVVYHRVVPALRQEFRNNKMVPFVLPIILLVAEDCTMQEYSDVILPVLIPALRIRDPIQVPLILLQKMDLLLKKTTPDDVKQHILPMIITSLETTNTQLQELCISSIPSFATTIDYSSMKHSIIPRLTALMITGESVSLRVKCLVAVAKMLDSLDKHIVQDHILPLMKQIPSREPGVLMAVLGIYHSVMKNKKMGMDKVALATDVLPFLVPLSVEPSLNITQFNQFMRVIREMLQAVETEQQAHLEQLSKMEEQTRSTVEFARDVSEAKAMEDTVNKFEEKFGGSSGSHDSHVIQKRGAMSPPPRDGGSLPLTTTASKPNHSSHDGFDMFAGMFAGPATTSSSSSSTSSSFLTTAPPSSSTMSSANNQILTPLPPFSSSSSSSSPSQTSSLRREVKVTSSSSSFSSSSSAKPQPLMQPIIQPSKAIINPEPTVTPLFVNPQPTRSPQSALVNPQPTRNSPLINSKATTSSSFNPVLTGNATSFNPKPTGREKDLFSGMQVNSLTGNSMSTNQISEQSHVTGGSSPLVAKETKLGMGWSSSINKGTSPASPSMGWSDNVAVPLGNWTSQIPIPNQQMTPLQPVAASSSGNWMSQNPIPNQQMGTTLQPSAAPSGNWMAQTPTNQPMMNPLQPSMAVPSVNWTMQSQQQQPPQAFAQSGNWMAQVQPQAPPTAANLMSGGGPSLQQPSGDGNRGNQGQIQPTAASGNPFADLSFLG